MDTNVESLKVSRDTRKDLFKNFPPDEIMQLVREKVKETNELNDGKLDRSTFTLGMICMWTLLQKAKYIKMEEKPLKTLAEHESEKFMRDNIGRPNGIACPECGKEMLDKPNSIVHTSYPAKVQVFCMGCDHQTYRTL